jgi:hypothetical protein
MHVATSLAVGSLFRYCAFLVLTYLTIILAWPHVSVRFKVTLCGKRRFPVKKPHPLTQCFTNSPSPHVCCGTMIRQWHPERGYSGRTPAILGDSRAGQGTWLQRSANGRVQAVARLAPQRKKQTVAVVLDNADDPAVLHTSTCAHLEDIERFALRCRASCRSVVNQTSSLMPDV